jgi:hypothetical protein
MVRFGFDAVYQKLGSDREESHVTWDAECWIWLGG